MKVIKRFSVVEKDGSEKVYEIGSDAPAAMDKTHSLVEKGLVEKAEASGAKASGKEKT